MRIYATREDDGRQVLAAIRCDGEECEEEITPGLTRGRTGWMIARFREQNPARPWFDYCPACWPHHVVARPDPPDAPEAS